jgi:outer membrane protein assembly factor BamB
MGGHIYGADHRGILRCLELAPGKQVWENDTVTPEANWATVHLIREGASDRFWLFSERGELIIARLSPAGYEEVARTSVIAPTRGSDPVERGR